MSRYTPEHKRQTRKRVLEAAGQRLRKEGPSGATIPSIMSSVGLTQGAFYAHFESKDDLLAEANAEALATASARLLARGHAAAPGSEMETIVRHYLSREHRDNLMGGCPIPVFSADAVRGPARVRSAYTQALTDLFDGLAGLVPESAGKAFPNLELGLASTMVGGLLLSRAVDDPDLSDQILTAARAFCLRVLGGGAQDGSAEDGGAQ